MTTSPFREPGKPSVPSGLDGVVQSPDLLPVARGMTLGCAYDVSDRRGVCRVDFGAIGNLEWTVADFNCV